MSTIVNLNAIFLKVRKLSASSNTYQLPNYGTTASGTSAGVFGIADYINSFYNYDLPAEFRSLKLKDIYTFVTQAGIDTYPFNSEQYTTVEMPCYCAKREIKLFNDPWSFYGVNYNWQQSQNFTTGNGTTGPYIGTTTAFPLIKSYNNVATYQGTPNTPGVSQGNEPFPASRVMNLLITANVGYGTTSSTLNVTDDGNGNLVDATTGAAVVGSINYQTGAISVTFSQNIPQGNSINIQYNPTQPNIPLSIMFFQNNFTLRPVPDKGYTIELVAYRQPSQALLNLGQVPNGTGTPELSEWWETLAVGAAKKIYEDRLDFDGVDMMDRLLQQKYDLIRTRTYAQLGKQRISTLYTDQLSYNYGGSLGIGIGGTGV